MKSTEEIGDLIEKMVDARLSGQLAVVVETLHDLLRGPRGDVMNVTLVLAGVLAEDLKDVEPELGFHTVTVTQVDAEGNESRGSTHDVPGHVATFAQMVAAIANQDKSLAKDLFLGYCGDDGQRALSLLVFGLNEVVHANAPCAECDGLDEDDRNVVAQ